MLLLVIVQVAGRTVLAGVRFLPVAKEAEDIIEHLLGKVQGGGGNERAEGPSVISEFSECVRPSGLRIVLCHDRREPIWRTTHRLWCWLRGMERANEIMCRWPTTSRAMVFMSFAMTM